MKRCRALKLGLPAIGRGFHLIPFRTQKLNRVPFLAVVWSSATRNLESWQPTYLHLKASLDLAKLYNCVQIVLMRSDGENVEHAVSLFRCCKPTGAWFRRYHCADSQFTILPVHIRVHLLRTKNPDVRYDQRSRKLSVQT